MHEPSSLLPVVRRELSARSSFICEKRGVEESGPAQRSFRGSEPRRRQDGLHYPIRLSWREQIRRAENPCGLSDPAVRKPLLREALSAKDLVAGARVPEGGQASRDGRLLLAFGGLQLPELIQFA